MIQNLNTLRRIVVTGPESTGKTELAKALSERLNGNWIPEYAREYVENLHHPYDYGDVVRIAQHQIHQEQEASAGIGNGFLIFDTWLIITKVWFDQVYGHSPGWITDYIRSSEIDLFLVCDTDLPWLADPVRENGGEMRDRLLKIYCQEIENFGFEYEIIGGFGNERVENALAALYKHGLKL